MAKIKKKVKKKTKSQSKKKSFINPKLQISLILLMVACAVFLSTAVIFFIGLLPMFVAFFTDKTPRKVRSVTVGAMNFAGCMPFVIELWTTDNSLEKALSIILDPFAIIVIYSAAGVGYIIDWAVSVLVANIMYQRGLKRQKTIAKRQKELIKNWGREVSGEARDDGLSSEEEGAAPL